MISIDASAVQALARDFGLVSRELDDAVRKVVFKGAMNVKRDWQSNARASGGRVGSQYAGSIQFDSKDSGHTAEVEAKGAGAQYGAILEYGTATSPPHNDAKRAIDKEAPKFEKALEKVAQDVLK